MKYRKWTHRNGSLVVEQYVGAVELEHVIALDDQMLTEVPSGIGQLLCLTDISRATFSNLSHEQLVDAFQSIDDHFEKTRRMKLALFTGMNRFEDYQKASTYVRHGERRDLSVLFFNALDTAMIWLGLHDAERALITEQLRGTV